MPRPSASVHAGQHQRNDRAHLQDGRREPEEEHQGERRIAIDLEERRSLIDGRRQGERERETSAG